MTVFLKQMHTHVYIYLNMRVLQKVCRKLNLNISVGRCCSTMSGAGARLCTVLLAWEAVDGGRLTSPPGTRGEDLHGVPGAWTWPGPALALVSM